MYNNISRDILFDLHSFAPTQASQRSTHTIRAPVDGPNPPEPELGAGNGR
jgi:hypothetical protein